MEMRNPNFTKEIVKTPDPETTVGLFYIKPFFTFDGRYGCKRWIKKIYNQRLKYSFDTVWLID